MRWKTKRQHDHRRSWCAMNNYHMGTTAENIAREFDISKKNKMNLQHFLKIKQRKHKRMDTLKMKSAQ